MKAQYPLPEARVTVKEIPGAPGSYNAVAYLRPWLQMEELTTVHAPCGAHPADGLRTHRRIFRRTAVVPAGEMRENEQGVSTRESGIEDRARLHDATVSADGPAATSSATARRAILSAATALDATVEVSRQRGPRRCDPALVRLGIAIWRPVRVPRALRGPLDARDRRPRRLAERPGRRHPAPWPDFQRLEAVVARGRICSMR